MDYNTPDRCRQQIHTYKLKLYYTIYIYIYIGDILENNYGKESNLDSTHADCFIRIPKSSIKSQSITAVPTIGRYTFFMALPQYSYFCLKDAKASISCFQCKNVYGERVYEVDCDECDGKKFQEQTCRACHGSGSGKPRYKKCKKCKSGIIEKINTIYCRFCNYGRSKQGCRHCYGNGYTQRYYHDGELYEKKCNQCDGDGEIKGTCNACNGKYAKEIKSKISCDYCDGKGSFRRGYYKCKACSGSKYQQIKCHECHGKGCVTRSCDGCDGDGLFEF